MPANPENPLHRISEFLERMLSQSGIVSRAFRWIGGPTLPRPYRDLLVHDRDMTSTLASFHGSEIGLDVLNVSHSDDEYVREVILYAKATGAPVEYGAIAIALQHFSPEQRAAIVEATEPLGGILNRMERAYDSRPCGFFSVAAPAICQERFGCSGSVDLYGRHNQLFNGENEELASIIEILPRMESESG